MARKIASIAVKIGFITAAFILIFRPEVFGLSTDLFQDITPRSLWDVVAAADTSTAVFWLGFALVAKLGGIFAGVIRWHLLLRGQKIELPFWYLAKCWFTGRAIGLFLPGTLGLDGYRLIESARHTQKPIECASVILVEKLIGFIALGTLVFLTLPLGMRFLAFEPVLLLALLAALAVFIATALTFLLNPSLIPWFLVRIPTPKKLRALLSKIGKALVAYSGQRRALITATVLGLGVHLGICLMYFGTASAIRAANTSLLDILFASPLVIVGSVIGPTVSGTGVREVVFGYFFADKAGAAAAVTFGHLGLWVGEIIPFTLSLPLILFAGRPNREGLLEQMAEIQAELRANSGDDEEHTRRAV